MVAFSGPNGTSVMSNVAVPLMRGALMPVPLMSNVISPVASSGRVTTTVVPFYL